MAANKGGLGTRRSFVRDIDERKPLLLGHQVEDNGLKRSGTAVAITKFRIVSRLGNILPGLVRGVGLYHHPEVHGTVLNDGSKILERVIENLLKMGKDEDAGARKITNRIPIGFGLLEFADSNDEITPPVCSRGQPVAQALPAFTARRRMTMSVGPPGGRGLIREIGRVGNFSSAANAGERETTKDNNQTIDKGSKSFLHFSSLYNVLKQTKMSEQNYRK